MSYELAKELKDAGFPQEPNGLGRWIDKFSQTYSAFAPADGSDAYIPTLSELIEACGQYAMTHGEGMEAYRIKIEGGQVEKSQGWIAELADSSFGAYGTRGEGEIVIEAVARLFINLIKTGV